LYGSGSYFGDFGRESDEIAASDDWHVGLYFEWVFGRGFESLFQLEELASEHHIL